MATNLAENDPYRNMGSGQQDIRPGFLFRRRGGEDDERARARAMAAREKELDKRLSSKEASDDLGSREKESSKPLEAGEDGLGGVRNREGSPGGLYTGGKIGGGKKDKKKKGKGFLKKSGPIWMILGSVSCGGALMMGSQSFMPMAIEEVILQKFNSIGVSTTVASDAWLNAQLNQGVRDGSLKTGYTSDTMLAFSQYQVQAFESKGLEVVQADGGSSKITAILYKKNGVWIPVVGSNALKSGSISEADLINAIKSASEHDNIGSPVSVETALADPDFKTPYTAASKTWRGGSSGWFDEIMSNVTEVKLGINRNRWRRWARVAKKTTKDIRKEFEEIAKSANKEKTSDSGLKRNQQMAETEGDGSVKTDGDGNTVYGAEEDMAKVEMEDTGEVVDTDTASTSIGSEATPEDISKALTSKAVKAAGKVDDVVNVGCALIEGLVSIYATVSAYQYVQSLNLISGFLEAVDRVKVGDDSSSPIHEYGTNLTTPGVTTDDDDNVVSNNKSAMASAGMAWLFGGSKISQNDQSVRNVNFESVMSNTSSFFKAIGTTMDVYANCGYAKAGAAAVNLAVTVISFIPVVGQAVKGVQLTYKAVGKIVLNAAVRIGIMIAIPIAAKILAKMMMKDVATEWFGEDLGNMLISGANKYIGGNGTSGGQSPGGEAQLTSYLNERASVIAEEAKYQRSIRSQFDISSPYTFLGALVYPMLPLLYSSNNLMGVVKNSSTIMRSSIASLSPTATAISAEEVLGSKGKCRLLESTGAIGDAFCNPYIITDVSTIRESPVAVNEIVHRMKNGDSEIASNGNWIGISSGDNFNDDGSIKENSNLAKYITFCGQRTSQYGIYDLAIASRISENTATKIMDYIPLANDVSGIFKGLTEAVNQAWTNGRACVASDTNPYWGENKWYQRYTENERQLENMNPGYVSPVTAYVQNYNEKNPVDNTLEGKLARFSGMRKEDVEKTLALIDYYNFIADYDASTRYAFGAPAVEEPNEILFNNDNVVAENVYIILLNEISFADVRNRSFVV